MVRTKSNITASFWLHRLLATVFLAVSAMLLLGFPTAVSARASLQQDALIRALDLDSIIEIMRVEGVDYAVSLEDELFPGKGGAAWRAQVDLIYSPENMWQGFGPRFDKALAGQDMQPVLDFFTSDLGQKIVGLEISARRALLDNSVEEMARDKLMQMREDNSPRLELLRDFIETNDLIELNVVGALNSNFAFYKGLEQGGAFPEDMTEEQMLRDVWAQEEDIRAETTDWLFSYLAMAYQPLSDDELRIYIAFSHTPEGAVMNNALFKAFDGMFDDISLALGLAAAEQIKGQDL